MMTRLVMDSWVLDLPEWALDAAKFVTRDNSCYVAFIIIGVLGLALVCRDIWRANR